MFAVFKLFMGFRDAMRKHIKLNYTVEKMFYTSYEKLQIWNHDAY